MELPVSSRFVSYHFAIHIFSASTRDSTLEYRFRKLNVSEKLVQFSKEKPCPNAKQYTLLTQAAVFETLCSSSFAHILNFHSLLCAMPTGRLCARNRYSHRARRNRSKRITIMMMLMLMMCVLFSSDFVYFFFTILLLLIILYFRLLLLFKLC